MQSGSDDGAGGVREGSILAGKFRIEKVLGSGGMGVVVAAQHIHLDDKVAIKFLLPEALRSPEAVARFAREARAAVKIKSEHVARVSDVGTLENGAPYMVMEYLQGGDLAGWLEERGVLPVEQAVEFVLQACEAIAEAHSIGIIHRDLKPANLFVIRRADGGLSVKVLDFGISKLTGVSASGPEMGMTKTSTMMGSPLYMSPEQMESAKSADARSDIWSLGAILYELVCGQPPFNGETLPEVFTRILQHQPPPMSSYRPDLPPGFEAVVLRCLEKNRANRYQNVGELAVALVQYGSKRSHVSAERIANLIQGAGLSTSELALPPSSRYPAPQMAQSAPQMAQSAPDGSVAPWGNTTVPREHRSGRAAIIAVAAVVVVGGLAAGVFALRGRSSSAPVAASAAVPAAAPSASVAPEVASVDSTPEKLADDSDAAPPGSAAAATKSPPAAATRKPPAKTAVAGVVRTPTVKKTAPVHKRAPATKRAPKKSSLDSLINDRL